MCVEWQKEELRTEFTKPKYDENVKEEGQGGLGYKVEWKKVKKNGGIKSDDVREKCKVEGFGKKSISV